MYHVGNKRKKGKTASRVVSLKCRLYLSLHGHGIAVFTDDILNSAGLDLCGCHLPAAGIELLKLLIELAQDGKVVVWQDERFLGFLPIKIWEREMAEIKVNILRETCEAMRLNPAEENLWGVTLGAVLTPVLTPNSRYNPRKRREGKLNETPNHRYGKGNHEPAEYGERAGKESVIPAHYLGEAVGEEAEGHGEDGAESPDLGNRDAGETVDYIQMLLTKPDPFDNQRYKR